MQQVKVFNLSSEINEANEFLAKNPPAQMFNHEGLLVVHFDDQSYPAEYRIEECRALMLSNTKACMTSEISLRVTEIDFKKFDGQYAELTRSFDEIKSEHDALKATLDDKDAWKGKKEERAAAVHKLMDLGKRLSTLEKEKATVGSVCAEMVNAMNELKESIARNKTRNLVLQETIDRLNAGE